jgi:predicted nuclease of restriction endonuclease-like RecB superfamily
MPAIKFNDTKFYRISVAPEKNRAYLKILGFWRNTSVVPDYLNDWTKAMSMLKQGFTLLTDASEMKTHPQDVRKLHEQAQAIILKAGVSKVAEVLKDDVAEMQLDAVAKTTQFPKKNFKTAEEAEKWLDE